MPPRHLLSFLEHQFEHGGAVGPHCSFCGTFTGPFSEIEGLFTVLICIPCLEVRLAQPDTLLGLHDPGLAWAQWAARSRAAAAGSSAPGTWSGTPRPSIPAGRPPTSCCGPTRTSASESCTAVARRRRADTTGPAGGSGSPSSMASSSSSWSWSSSWSTIRRTSTKPKAARSRRRAASWSGSTAAMGRASYRRVGWSRRASRCR
jgi:hypothetical protein